MKTPFRATLTWLSDDGTRGIVKITKPFGFSSTTLKQGFIEVTDPNAEVGHSQVVSGFAVLSDAKEGLTESGKEKLDNIELLQ